MSVFDDDEISNLSLSLTDNDSSSSAPILPRLALLDGTFFKYLPNESTAQKIIAQCTKCPSTNPTKVKGYDNCTSNFLSHLKRKHGNDCVGEYKAYIKKKKEDKKDDQTSGTKKK